MKNNMILYTITEREKWIYAVIRMILWSIPAFFIAMILKLEKKEKASYKKNYPSYFKNIYYLLRSLIYPCNNPDILCDHRIIYPQDNRWNIANGIIWNFLSKKHRQKKLNILTRLSKKTGIPINKLDYVVSLDYIYLGQPDHRTIKERVDHIYRIMKYHKLC